MTLALIIIGIPACIGLAVGAMAPGEGCRGAIVGLVAGAFLGVVVIALLLLLSGAFSHA